MVKVKYEKAENDVILAEKLKCYSECMDASTLCIF